MSDTPTTLPADPATAPPADTTPADAPAGPAAPPAVPSFRASASANDTLVQLGPLADLAGRWQGQGFNLISRPDFREQKPFFLELNSTQETLTFTPIGAPIPNRGPLQDDIVRSRIRTWC
jgi:hypothetical protein